MKRRILYIQYTNPACYPALMHSSHILAEKGWHVLFLHVGSFGASRSLRLAPHENVTARKLPCDRGERFQLLRYAWFSLWALFWVMRWRPQWIYASDFRACPGALIVSYLFPGIKMIYHEHDTPEVKNLTEKRHKFIRLILKARKRLIHRSLCILPSRKRVGEVMRETGKNKNIFCIWNCPRTEEVAGPKPLRKDDKIRLYYHGVIDKNYLSPGVLKAIKILDPKVELKIIGYETKTSEGYTDYLRGEARRLGVINRIKILEAMPRHELLRESADCDVGLAFIPRRNQDLNNRYKIGASNRVFDYLAGGLALLVSDLADWRRVYVESGYGLACDPEDPDNIAVRIRWFLEHPRDMRRMGEAGRQRILKEWNYEKQFLPVLKKIEKGYD